MIGFGQRRALSRRQWLAALGLGGLACAVNRRDVPVCLAAAAGTVAVQDTPFFRTRGVVIRPSDILNWTWPEKAKEAGLSTIGTHMYPQEVAGFVKTDAGQAFLESCKMLGLEVEHELHAMNDLLPRDLFDKNPAMFRMDEQGQRVREWNLCVHSQAAVATVCENAVKYATLLRPTTGRYFYWIDDGQPMCRCPECRGLSDSDQALVLENAVLKALKQIDPRAALAHLAYARTIKPPTQVKPEPGIFLEFAPIARRFDRPLSAPDIAEHREFLADLDANLTVFGPEDAQALEYWLDESLFCRWKKENLCRIPWNEEVFLDDLATYGNRGIRHVTTFAVLVDGKYVAQFGEPPLQAYGAGLSGFRPA